MSNNAVTFPLKVLPAVEPIDSWESLCKNPTSFLTEVASRLIAVGVMVSDRVIVSDKVPANEDRTKIWVKTSFPYGIGFVVEGSYQMDYGASGFPVNIPFLQTDRFMEPLLAGIRKLSDTEVKQYGLPATKSDATDRMNWYIFQPPEISY